MTVYRCCVATLAAAEGEGARATIAVAARDGVLEFEVSLSGGAHRRSARSTLWPGACDDPRRHARGDSGSRRGASAPSLMSRRLGQVEDDGLHALVDRGLPAEPQLEEDRVNHLLDRALGQEERRGDRGVVLAGGHLAQHVQLARRQIVERRLLGARVLRDERLDDLRIHHRAAVGDCSDRRDELLEIRHPLLQEVRTACGPALEQRQRVARLGVLAEHDDADLRLRLAQAARPPGCLRRLPVGGIRMSVTTTSGSSASTAASSESRSPHAATTSTSGLVSSRRRVPSRTR